MKKYRFAGGHVITGGVISKEDVLVTCDRIEAVIDPDTPISDDYILIDCTDKYVSPGFVDIHQHGGGGADYMDDAPDTYYNATTAHLRHGTTSIMPTSLSADKNAMLGAVRSYIKAKNDPRIKCNLLGLHMEGPYISPRQAGAQKPENIRAFDENEYKEVIKAANGNIKRWSVAPEVDGAEKFAKYAKENGITLSIAHSAADFETVQKAYEWGFKHVTHLYSCMSTIERRGGFRVAGVLEAAYYIDGMNVEIIADGCHLPHSLLAYVAKFKNADNIALITDSMRAAGQDTKTSYLGSIDDPLHVIIEDGVAKLLDRSAFAGSVATADRLVRNMVKAGVDLASAVKMITENPIRMMELDVKKGSILQGFDADICVFDKDINIEHVMCMGELIV